MIKVELFELELGRYDWAAMRCGCDRSELAGHLPEILRRAAAAATPKEARELWNAIDYHLLPAGHVLAEPSLPTLHVLLAALADGVPERSRAEILHLILALIGDNGQVASPVFAGRSLVDECRAAARAGLWIFYAEVLSGDSVGSATTAFEIAQILDDDEERLNRVQAAAGERLPWHLQPGTQIDWDSDGS
ncbi:hypothetical protein [Saccharothrix australiensis]|uniref:hypothetical protein n=1 Tax=Saccharothrix australiensis TaxID=2072 RepID=UPI0011C3C156|nr:hypothetical protein [Saccharothrix australiensis]